MSTSDKQRGFELLKQLDAIRAVAEFSGGNDEGGIESAYIVRRTENGTEVNEDLDHFYPSYYQAGQGYVNTPREQWSEMEELYLILDKPIDDKYSTFAGEFHAYGQVVLDLEKGTFSMDDHMSREEYDDFHEEW